MLPLSLISKFLAFRPPHSLSGVLPSNMLLSEILLIACSHYLNEQLGSESINVIPVLFLLVFKQHELYLHPMTSWANALQSALGFHGMGKYLKVQKKLLCFWL